MKTCMFTGHRPQSLPFRFNENDPRCYELKKHLRDLIHSKIMDGVTHFLSGMALGIDSYAAEIVLDFQKEFPDVTIDAIIPCANQFCKWNEKQISRYNEILKKCNRKIVLQETYTADCMEKRNHYMVDNSDYVIAVWNGTSSGTSKTIRYAMSKNRPITILHPVTYSVQFI